MTAWLAIVASSWYSERMDKKIEMPAISTTDENGVRWELDPNKNRWSATVAGKKISSGHFDKLREKVEAAAPQATNSAPSPAPASPQRQVEAAMISITYDRFHSSKTLNLLQDKIILQSVVVKMEWNAEKAAMEVVRYKGADGGWKQRNADGQILFHPSSVPDHIQDLLSRAARGRIVSHLYRAAERDIGQAWWRSKPDQTARWEVVHGHGIQPTQQPASSSNPRSTAHTNPGWVLTAPETLTDFSGWSQTEAGDLRRDGVSIKMAVSSRGSPTFSLHMDGTDHAISSEQDLAKLLLLGNATHSVLAQPAAVSYEWAGYKGWEADNKGMGSWPIRRAVHAAALFEGSSSMRFSHTYPEAYVLAQDAPETMSATSTSASRAMPGLEWKPSNPHYHPASFRDVGPEDAALEHLFALRARRDAFEPDPFSMADMASLTPAVLAEVAGMVEDGEELTTDLAVMDKLLKTLVDRHQDRQSKDPMLIEWQQQCRDAVAQAHKVIDLHATTASEPRKPKI